MAFPPCFFPFNFTHNARAVMKTRKTARTEATRYFPQNSFIAPHPADHFAEVGGVWCSSRVVRVQGQRRYNNNHPCFIPRRRCFFRRRRIWCLRSSWRTAGRQQSSKLQQSSAAAAAQAAAAAAAAAKPQTVAVYRKGEATKAAGYWIRGGTTPDENKT